MNSQTQRRELVAGAELVSPLAGPSYGAYSIAKRRWQKPLAAVIADAIANNRAIITRLKLGVIPPDFDDTSHYRKIFDQLCASTVAQIAALEVFRTIEWSE
jgi:hypothetical protein